MVSEAMASNFKVKEIFYVPRLAFSLREKYSQEPVKTEITENEAYKISNQKTPQGIFAEIEIPADFYSENFKYPANDLIIALHSIQDPGNLGTIVRTADWFGIKQIICSRETVDILNPKVLQSTMGAAFRVKITYTDILKTIKAEKDNHPGLPVFAAILEGNNIYTSVAPSHGILMMGNESKGLSHELITLATHKITIPKFGNSAEGSESLNVSVATAIIIAEMRRKII